MTSPVGNARLGPAGSRPEGIDKGDYVRSRVHWLAHDESIAERTLNTSGAGCKPPRYDHRVRYKLLVERIKERLDATGLSETAACKEARVGVNSIRHIRRRDHAPKAETLAKLAVVLGVPPVYFLEAASLGASQPDLQPAHVLETVYVKGAVQAGAWQLALEWDPSEWYAVTVPPSRKYPGLPRFALEVRGNSMDREFPNGSVVAVVKLEDLGRLPEPTEYVVVLRRSLGQEEFEATLKQYERDQNGRHLLWPRSTDPEYQVPFIFPPDALPVSDGRETLPRTASAGAFQPGLNDAEYLISAIVVGAYRDM